MTGNRSLLLILVSPLLMLGAGQVSAENTLRHEGYQFRLIWPETGELSPDVIADQATRPPRESDIFCGEAAFANGESYQSLGAPFRGLLLVGVRGEGPAPGISASAMFQLMIGEESWAVPVFAQPGATVWYPVAVFPAEGWGPNIASFEGQMRAADAAPHALPRIRSSCNE